MVDFQVQSYQYWVALSKQILQKDVSKGFPLSSNLHPLKHVIIHTYRLAYLLLIVYLAPKNTIFSGHNWVKNISFSSSISEKERNSRSKRNLPKMFRSDF